MVNHVHTRVLTSVTLACSPSTNGYGCDNRTHSHGVSSSLPASVIDCEFAKNLLACALGSRAIALPSMNVVRLVNVQCGPIVQCTEFCVNGITSLELATGPITTTIWTQLHIVNCYSVCCIAHDKGIPTRRLRMQLSTVLPSTRNSKSHCKLHD